MGCFPCCSLDKLETVTLLVFSELDYFPSLKVVFNLHPQLELEFLSEVIAVLRSAEPDIATIFIALTESDGH